MSLLGLKSLTLLQTLAINSIKYSSTKSRSLSIESKSVDKNLLAYDYGNEPWGKNNYINVIMAEKQPQISKQSGNIEVYIRVRPYADSQPSHLSCLDSFDEKEIVLRDKQSAQTPTFSFDRIFNSGSTQQELYQEVTHDIIDNAFEGINGTVFCYGQTSSGKTYTCIGKNESGHPEQRGILLRMVDDIFSRMQQLPKQVECKMKISMIEIYNQKIKDLLDYSKSDLKIRSDKSRGIFIEHVTEKYLLSPEEATGLILRGVENRSVAYTNMNAVSSRSHMLFLITIHQHDFYTGEARAAKITLVDLAGSEKISKTGVEGKLLEQAKKINTSLSALGKVINALSEGKKTHVPYRDSKLTRLLQESIGGNSITKLIINISPALNNYQETLSSLRFGFRAKSVKNEPRVNKEYTVPELLELLNKAEKKIKILTTVIKQIMKEKGQEIASFKDFARQYLQETEQGYVSEESEDQPTSLIRSISGRFPFRKNSLAAKINPEHEELLKLPLKLQEKRPHQTSLVNLFKSSNLGTHRDPSSINPMKQSKNKSFNKEPNTIIQMQKLNNKGTQSDESLLLNEDDRLHELNFVSQDGKSINLGPSCTINSRVLNLSVVSAQPRKQNCIQPEIKLSREWLPIGNEDDPIEANIIKIRNNLRKLSGLRSRFELG